MGVPGTVYTIAVDNCLPLTDAYGYAIRFRYDPAGNTEAMYHGALVADGQAIPSAQLIAKYRSSG